ncbi:major facilitator superfamily domain-containing protein [Xylariaceae sp. FL1651]|nr:major facilitator superfamily domain-containing protein [Xylariaceae sp. FL1651]
MVDDRESDHRSDAEKATVVRTIADMRVLGLTEDDAHFYESFPSEKRKKLVRKVDVRLVPMLALLYLISQLDRANIGNAKIEGLNKDLGLTGIQYNIVTSIFFVPYVLFELPSNAILKKCSRPSYYLGTLTTIWGVIMLSHGFVKNYGQLAVRILLGTFEAGFFPGALYLCTYWYMPKELASRIAIFYTTSSLSGAFSGLLAAAIAKLGGRAGISGWQWIFIIEGAATVLVGILCFFCLIDSPKLSKRWLDPESIRYLELQIFIKQGGRFTDEKKDFLWADLKTVVTNPHIYGHAWLLFCQSACSYGNKFTLPSITAALGFSNTNAQLLTVPPYIAGAISSFALGVLSDHYYWRMPFVVGPLTLIAIGYSVIVSFKGDLQNHIAGSLVAIIIAVAGIYPIQPADTAWGASNLAPAGRRAIGIGFFNGVGNTGGILGSYIYLDSQAPAYPVGFGVCIALALSGVIVALTLEFSYMRENKKRATLSESELRATYSEDETLRMGEKSPFFKYTY